MLSGNGIGNWNFLFILEPWGFFEGAKKENKMQFEAMSLGSILPVQYMTL